MIFWLACRIEGRPALPITATVLAQPGSTSLGSMPWGLVAAQDELWAVSMLGNLSV